MTTRAVTSATSPSTSPWYGMESSSLTTRSTSKVQHFLFSPSEAPYFSALILEEPAGIVTWQKFESALVVYLSVMIFCEAATPCAVFLLHKKSVISFLTAIRERGESVPSVWKNTILVSGIKEGQRE